MLLNALKDGSELSNDRSVLAVGQLSPLLPDKKLRMSDRRGLVSTPLGSLHYVATGSLDSNALTPVLCFHMSPRSCDEYTEVQTILSSADHGGRLVIAIDEPGYGQSDNPTRSCSLDEIADCMLLVADALGVDKFVAAGSLMGCYFALSLASRKHSRVKAVVCTNLYHFLPDAREKALVEEQARLGPDTRESSIDDSWKIAEDGSHISNIWGVRSSFLEPELNTRAVLDNLTYLMKKRDILGISIQEGPAFDLESAANGTDCPVLCIQGEGATAFFDSIGYNMTGQFQEAVSFFPGSVETLVLTPGSINLINQNSNEWAKSVTGFLEKVADNV